MPRRSKRPAWSLATTAGMLTLGLAACGNQLATDASALGNSDSDIEQDSRDQREHLALRIPIAAVMTGTINQSSYQVFQAATSADDLSETGWLAAGEAAVSLVGAATLITVPGTGPQDAAWTSDPRWKQLSKDMQSASLSVGAAASGRNRAALTESASRLAQSCQSCHLVFSARLLTSPGSDLEAKR